MFVPVSWIQFTSRKTELNGIYIQFIIKYHTISLSVTLNKINVYNFVIFENKKYVCDINPIPDKSKAQLYYMQ